MNLMPLEARTTCKTIFQIIASLLTDGIWSVNVLINCVPSMEMREKLLAPLPRPLN